MNGIQQNYGMANYSVNFQSRGVKTVKNLADKFKEDKNFSKKPYTQILLKNTNLKIKDLNNISKRVKNHEISLSDAVQLIVQQIKTI